MKNLLNILENKFLIKKNISKEKEYKVYKHTSFHNNASSYMVYINSIEQLKELKVKNIDFYNEQLIKYKKALLIRPENEENYDNGIAFNPFYSKLSKNEYKTTITADEFTLDNWKKQKWDRHEES